MPRLFVGSLIAAVAMFLLGFVFYGTPLMQFGWIEAPREVQASVQAALKALPGTGTYTIPSGDDATAVAAFAAGPVAQVKVNMAGASMFDPGIFAGGFVHMAVSVFLLGCVLRTAPASEFATRARLVLGIAALAVVYLHIAGPVWYHTDWRNALYTSVADFIVLSVGGLIVARWFVSRAG